MEIFVLAADTGSLSAAARHLNLSPAVASLALKRLEEELDTRLFLRTTRSLRLTTEGQIFLEPCRQALRLLQDGLDAALSGGGTLRGTLQISSPSDLGRNAILSWLDEFQGRHPRIQLHVQLSDRLADMYREPVDLALRYGLLPDSSLVALPVAPKNRRILCASPEYLQRAGTPASPEALMHHNCLCFRLSDYIHDHWRFSLGGNELCVKVSGNRASDDGDAVRRWVLAGQGIAYKSALDVADDVRAGRLVQLCHSWVGESAPLSLVCAERRRISPLVQALQTFLAERCALHLDGIIPTT